MDEQSNFGTVREAYPCGRLGVVVAVHAFATKGIILDSARSNPGRDISFFSDLYTVSVVHWDETPWVWMSGAASAHLYLL